VSIRTFFWIYLIAEEGSASIDYAIMRWPKFPGELISNSCDFLDLLSIEYYLVVVDRLRSYHLVIQVDFCVFLNLFKVELIWSQAMGTPMESWVNLLERNGDTNDLCFDDFQVETHVEISQVETQVEISQVETHADQCTPP
jgi:hypothetical protein